MRILGIESSSRRGSVALLEGGRLIASVEHEEPNAHAERLLPLLERLLADTGWPKSSLDRLGVGVGPGSFTGLRAGIALVEGLSVGLDRPLWGVGSLLAMARGALAEHSGPCCALLDARRNELFAAVYDRDLGAQREPCALPIQDLPAFLSDAGVKTVVGEVAATLDHGRILATGPMLDLPHAHWVAVLTGELEEAACPPEPQYVRGVGATLPTLPRSPINSQ
ncbi:MAG TPA: tRNA (adenosine(37)-N6)-threonylcarbamoyltransferase complex dimerization subunit type 1 TsaB [Polyangiaceae bacterium]|nr:tRNA (adenosine(37)-N6)-threonylcarbamoyltransferase complex dimerization subunit type 1 TsaB [Polyangiaceae bacterium]